MSLEDVIDRFATGTYPVTRTSAGAYVEGRYTPGSTTTFNVVASIQPLSGRDLQTLPEGQHASETRAVYTKTELQTRTPSSEPDRLTINGESWEVWQSFRWEAFGGAYYKAFISRAVTP